MSLLDEFLKDPSKIGIASLCLIAVAAFVREWIVPGVTYTKAISAKDVLIVKLEARIEKLEGERSDLKAMLGRAIEITDRTQQARRDALGDKT